MDFAVASVAGALGLDVEIATTSGRNVAENNAFSLFKSDSEDLAEQEDPEEEKQERGRSKEKRHFAERDESPDRLKDTAYEEITNSITQEMASWKPSAEQCLNGDVGVKNFARALAYLQLERINMLNQRLDTMTGGGWSTVLGSVDDGADIARTYTRRTVRFLTNDQRMAQNVGDYTYLALSVLGGKGLKSLGVAPTLASRASQLNKAALINKAVQKPTTASNGNTPVRTVAEQKQMLEGLDLAAGKTRPDMGEYRKTKGHHVHAKKAFEGHVNYDPKKGFSISESYMKKIGVRHADVTTAQRQLFKELSKSGGPNTLQEHSRIAVESLVVGGASRVQARALVANSLRDLKAKDVKKPTNIPWNNKK